MTIDPFFDTFSTKSGSALKLPRIAPEEGYNPKFTTSIGVIAGGPTQEDAVSNQNYFFRVRSTLDADGKISTAQYGKISGDIRLDPINSKTCLVQFTYYLNPAANDRNLEYDPKKNLAGDLPAMEQVKKP